MDPRAAADRIDLELRRAANPARAEHERAYLKSQLEHYGASVPVVRRVTLASLREAGAVEREALVALVETLWERPVHECRLAAVELLVARVAALESHDLALLERLLREAGTWALVDPLAAQVVGPLVEAEPALALDLERWLGDDHMWLRRAALLAHLLPMRRGDEAVFARFGRFADALLADRDPFIRKAIGWVLRERGRKRPDEVGAWLLQRRERVAGLTLREASRHLGDDWRARLLGP